MTKYAPSRRHKTLPVRLVWHGIVCVERVLITDFGGDSSYLVSLTDSGLSRKHRTLRNR